MEGAGSVGSSSIVTTVSKSIGAKLKTTSDGEVEDSFFKKAELEGGLGSSCGSSVLMSDPDVSGTGMVGSRSRFSVATCGGLGGPSP